eukprot:360643-Chlamydomonas_euryale.AAC.3
MRAGGHRGRQRQPSPPPQLHAAVGSLCGCPTRRGWTQSYHRCHAAAATRKPPAAGSLPGRLQQADARRPQQSRRREQGLTGVSSSRACFFVARARQAGRGGAQWPQQSRRREQGLTGASSSRACFFVARARQAGRGGAQWPQQ